MTPYKINGNTSSLIFARDGANVTVDVINYATGWIYFDLEIIETTVANFLPTDAGRRRVRARRPAASVVHSTPVSYVAASGGGGPRRTRALTCSRGRAVETKEGPRGTERGLLISDHGKSILTFIFDKKGLHRIIREADGASSSSVMRLDS